MNHKFRASYSVLSTWASGNWERAVKMYFKLENFTTPAMAAGKEYHELWDQYIAEHNKMPLELVNGRDVPMNNPKTEIKLVVQLDDWLEVVGKIDCLEAPIVKEWKTGKQSSEVYATSKQTGMYGILCTLPGVEVKDGKETPWPGVYVDIAEIYHYDQYKKVAEMSKVWLTDQLLKDTHNWILTLSSEMHLYFITNSLYEKFGANLKKA